jgi:hypothetical protein
MLCSSGHSRADLVDHAGALRWASASDQVAAPVSAGQERLAQGLAEVGVDVLQLLHPTAPGGASTRGHPGNRPHQLVGQDWPNVHRSFHSPGRKR